jgi:A/G-specific adenine glycosylase
MKPAEKLLAWYGRNGRRLPWRGTRDAYRILVSEMMLQQTQVHRVLAFYPRWLKTFPDWRSLAAAGNAQVISQWSGLGYNRRALMLRDIARQVVEHGLPKSEAAWFELKGIGPYTAAALASFSLHERTMPIDTNIRRTLGRLLLAKPFPVPTDDGRIRKAADAFMPKAGDVSDLPQALFDLATLVCKKNPDCAECPMRSVCPAAAKFLSGQVRVPKRSVKKPSELLHRNKPYPDRIYRGRILKLAGRTGGFPIAKLGESVDPGFVETKDGPWLAAMIDRLSADGLIKKHGGVLTLPH